MNAVLQVSKEFPHVDFSLISTDQDTWHDDDRRETIREVAERGQGFLRFLRSRPERNIAVVSHGVFLETLVGGLVLGVVDPRVSAERFRNCEMRAIVVGGWTIPSTASAGTAATTTSVIPRKRHTTATEIAASTKPVPAAAAAAESKEGAESKAEARSETSSA